MSTFFDKQGNEITMEEWDQLHSFEYKVIGRDTVGVYLVSTVWLGINHQFRSGPPLIFESMIFDSNGEDVYCARYATEEDALAGHKAAVEMAKLPEFGEDE